MSKDDQQAVSAAAEILRKNGPPQHLVDLAVGKLAQMLEATRETKSGEEVPDTRTQLQAARLILRHAWPAPKPAAAAGASAPGAATPAGGAPPFSFASPHALRETLSRSPAARADLFRLLQQTGGIPSAALTLTGDPGSLPLTALPAHTPGAEAALSAAPASPSAAATTAIGLSPEMQAKIRERMLSGR